MSPGVGCDSTAQGNKVKYREMGPGKCVQYKEVFTNQGSSL